MHVRKTLVGTAAALVAVGAVAPAVNAAKPSRTPIQPEPLTLGAGFACAFDVELRPTSGSRLTETAFDDGRILYTSNANTAVTNLDTLQSVVVRERGTLEVVSDESTNDLLIEASGQTIFYFFPGDQGPFGEVGENGALYHVVGHVRETWDLDSDVITALSLNGGATELCSQIE